MYGELDPISIRERRKRLPMHWYAISTKPHREYVAEANIHRLGVETFCPQIKQDRIIRRKMQSTIAPLFPGYLFAQFSIDQQYRAIGYARGVRRVVAFGSEPAIVDESLIEAIKCRLQEGYIVITGPQLLPGQTVRIENGPLQGFQGIFEREIPGHQRAVILLKALSYQARVVIDLQSVVNL